MINILKTKYLEKESQNLQPNKMHKDQQLSENLLGFLTASISKKSKKDFFNK